MSTPSAAYKIWRHPHLKLVDKCLQYVVWLAMRLDKLDSVAKLAGPEGATARRRFEQFNAGAAARFAKHWTTTVETTPEGVELIVYSPKHVDSPVPVVLWIHGGGFTIGGARDAFGAEICAAAVEAGGPPFAWVSVEYRLAPERASRAEDTILIQKHRHPAAADDCAAALRYLAASDRFSDIHVAGASAGANLAIVTAAAAPRLGITVASLFAVSPFVDPRGASASYAANANCHVAAPSWLAASWNAYVGPGPEAKERALADWKVCPHSADDTWRDAQDRPVAPPPTIIVTDTADPLRDEGWATVRSIRDAGCRDVLHLEGSASHCFTLKLYPAKRAEALAKWVGYFVSG